MPDALTHFCDEVSGRHHYTISPVAATAGPDSGRLYWEAAMRNPFRKRRATGLSKAIAILWVAAYTGVVTALAMLLFVQP